MSRHPSAIDRDLSDLPEGMRWREQMARRGAILASAKPIPRETFAGIIGDACRLDAFIGSIVRSSSPPSVEA